MGAHAFLAPSSAARIVVCPGSARAEAQYPDEVTQDSVEGDAVHWAGAAYLLYGVVATPGTVAENGVVLNLEMCDAANDYAGWILDTVPQGVEIHVEERVVIAALHAQNWGTPDCWFIVGDALYIFDLKYGHRWVDVWLNWQLINYAALIIHKLRMEGVEIRTVHFRIFQPRSYHRDGPKRTWSCNTGDLWPYWAELGEAFKAATGDNPLCVAADPAQCYDCKHRHNCQAATQAAYFGADLAYSAEPLEMSPAAMARELKLLRKAEDAITGRRKGIEQSIERTIRRQQSVPGFYLATKPGREVWTDAPGIVEIAAAFGVEVRTGPPAMMTPKQAIKAGVPADMVRTMSRINSGSVELVEDDGSAAARAFNDA